MDDKFRQQIITEAIEKVGSLSGLGRILGYTGKAPNWNVKQILSGRQGIALFRLERLCNFMNISLSDLQDKIKEIGKSTRAF